MNSQEEVQFEIALLLPEVEDSSDSCVVRLQRLLENQRGVTRAHLTEKGQISSLSSLRPNLLSLERMKSLTRQLGGQIAERYRHEMIPLEGHDSGHQCRQYRRRPQEARWRRGSGRQLCPGKDARRVRLPDRDSRRRDRSGRQDGLSNAGIGKRDCPKRPRGSRA